MGSHERGDFLRNGQCINKSDKKGIKKHLR